MGRVKSIGGVFFKTNDPEKSREWYKKHLGINSGQWGGCFRWKKTDSDEMGYTAWSPFAADTKYFLPSEKGSMVNYRVEDLEGLLKDLKEQGVEIVGEMEDYEYGKFAWIMDPDGYKIELWEPNDHEYSKILGEYNDSN